MVSGAVLLVLWFPRGLTCAHAREVSRLMPSERLY